MLNIGITAYVDLSLDSIETESAAVSDCHYFSVQSSDQVTSMWLVSLCLLFLWGLMGKVIKFSGDFETKD